MTTKQSHGTQRRGTKRAGTKRTPAKPKPTEKPYPTVTPEPRESYVARRDREMREEYLNSLSALVTGGLWVDDDQGGIDAEQAIIHVAAAQLKALLLAMSGASDDQGPGGWCLTDDELSSAEIAAVLSGVVSMLQGQRRVLSQLRAKGEFRSSLRRTQFERGEQAEGAS